MCVRDLHPLFLHITMEGVKGNSFSCQAEGKEVGGTSGSLLSTCSNVSILSTGCNLGVSGTRAERMGGFLDMSKANLT